MKPREYDLLTAAPAMDREGAGKQKGQPPGRRPSVGHTTVGRLRAINRAPALVRKLYVAGLIDAKLAELLRPGSQAEPGPEAVQ
jgi:hypothetical protein